MKFIDACALILVILVGGSAVMHSINGEPTNLFGQLSLVGYSLTFTLGRLMGWIR